MERIKTMILLYEFRPEIEFDELFYLTAIYMGRFRFLIYYRNKTESEIKNIICRQILYN